MTDKLRLRLEIGPKGKKVAACPRCPLWSSSAADITVGGVARCTVFVALRRPSMLLLYVNPSMTRFADRP